MITPGLLRRSLARAAQWRLLFIAWLAVFVPAAIATLPVLRTLSGALDHAPEARDNAGWMSGQMLVDLVKHLNVDTSVSAVHQGLVAGLIVLLLSAPFVAGAFLTAGASDEPLRLRALLEGAAGLYGRLFRAALVALVPFGLGFALTGAFFKVATAANEKEIWEHAADARLRRAAIVSAIVLVLFHSLADAMRAQFAAQPSRRSAWVALWAGFRLWIRRPLRTLAIAFVTALAAMLVALLLTMVRLRLDPSHGAQLPLAWLLAQGAVLAVSWGHGARLIGLAELTRADALERERRRTFAMEPPATSPPAPVAPPAEPDAAPPVLSPPPESGT